MPYTIAPTAIPDVLILEPKIFGDARGFFFESYNQRDFEHLTGLRATTFVQDNHSRSAQGVLRGLHYQLPPRAQGKLVRVVHGAVFDVAVDIRRGSATFGRWVGIELSADNHRQLWIRPGFAHGFLTLSEHADFLYKTHRLLQPRTRAQHPLGRPRACHRLARPGRAAAAVAQGRRCPLLGWRC